MIKTSIKVNKIDSFVWPQRCPHCGQDLKEGDGMGYELKIKKGLKGLLTSGFGQKHLPVRLCGTCAKKISYFRTVEAFGGITMFIAIAPFLFQRFIKIESIEIKYIMGSALWLGVILMGIAEMGIKSAIGVECRLISMNKWALKFRNDLFSNEFINLNSRHIERT